MKIALIDTGICKKEIKNRSKVKHFSLLNEILSDKYEEPINNHGTDCYKEIISNVENGEVQILDLNISDESGDIQVKNIILAIEKSIEEKVDIINVSLGLTMYSQELYDTCEKAVQNNIIILSAASHTNTVSFPADFKNVICVKVDQQQTEKVKAIDGTTVSISMRDFVIKEGSTEFDFSSSSLACARLCGYLCNEFIDMPLNDKFKMLFHKYNIKLYYSGENSNHYEVKGNGIHKTLLENRVAVVVFPSNFINILSKDIIHENIVAFYDHEKSNFYTFKENKQTIDFDVILIINAASTDLEVSMSIKEKYKNYKIICIGNFSKWNDNESLYDYKDYKSHEMSVLQKPVIAIFSLCSGLNKLDVQFSLLNSFRGDELDIEVVSNNPIGILHNANVFTFPSEIIFPNIVYSINQFMYLYEINKEFDAWLISVGGALKRVNSLNTYNFGKLADAYLSAANIDVAILCVNLSVDIADLKLHLSYLYKHGVEKVFIVLSHNDIDFSTMNYKDGLQTYCIDDTKYYDAFEYLKENVQETVFTLDDVNNGDLYQNIIKVLS